MKPEFKIEFLSPAEDEFLNSINYYNKESQGLGYEFALEVQKAIERIVQYPDAWTKLSKRTRKCRVNRFPYSVIYYYDNNLILIVAIMHLAKEPGYWKDRL